MWTASNRSQSTVIILKSADERIDLRSSCLSVAVIAILVVLSEDSLRSASASRCFRHHVTWLILPVVICLSQRLSHACLSISVSLRNCEWLIKTVIVSMSVVYYLDIHGNSRANTCVQTRLFGRVVLIRHWTNPGFPVSSWLMVIERIACFGGDDSFKFLTYQLSTVGYWPTVALTGNGELGFDSGEGAWETATTSKEGSRRANYPILTQGGSDKKYQYEASCLVIGMRTI